MEKPTCGIIQDLLISYSDGLTGESVTQMLQEHLDQCGECKSRYQEIERQRKNEDQAEQLRSDSFWNKLQGIRCFILGILIGLVLPVVCIAAVLLIRTVLTYLQTLVYGVFIWG